VTEPENATDVAAFDFDGTLTRGGSVFDFLGEVADRRRRDGAILSLAPQLLRAALAGGAAADQSKEVLFERVLAGISVEQATAVAESFADHHLRRRLRPEVRDRLDWHLDRGDRVVIVSASPALYITPAAAVLGVKNVIATGLEEKDGRLTGRYEGLNCRGTEKIRRLREWIDDTGGPPPCLWAYGNSRGDLAMLEAADVGVNAGKLGPFGRLRRFRSLVSVTASESRRR
jgi:phosphatidylglycerophosphatase C